MLNRINTNDILEVSRPHKTFFPDICVMCGACSELVSHMFLHCLVAIFLWNSLFNVFGECWVCPMSLDHFLMISYYARHLCPESTFLQAKVPHASA